MLKVKVRFKRRATAVSNSIDPIKFDSGTAVVRRLKPSRDKPFSFRCLSTLVGGRDKTMDCYRNRTLRGFICA